MLLQLQLQIDLASAMGHVPDVFMWFRPISKRKASMVLGWSWGSLGVVWAGFG